MPHMHGRITRLDGIELITTVSEMILCQESQEGRNDGRPDMALSSRRESHHLWVGWPATDAIKRQPLRPRDATERQPLRPRDAGTTTAEPQQGGQHAELMFFSSKR